MINLLGTIGSIATTFLEGRVEKAKGEIEIKKAEANAKAKLITSESDWEKIMAQGSQNSLKDEYLVILFSIPLILSFCGDWGREIVTNGFDALDKMPVWYQGALGAIIASTFAIRGATRFFKK